MKENTQASTAFPCSCNLFLAVHSNVAPALRATDRLGSLLTAATIADRKLDFQGDRVREGFMGRVPAGNGVGPL